MIAFLPHLSPCPNSENAAKAETQKTQAPLLTCCAFSVYPGVEFYQYSYKKRIKNVS